MKETFRQSMAWLHTWSGLLVGWLLFAIFLTGTASYYRQEISLWMRPALVAVDVAPAVAAARAVDRLRVIAPDAREWGIDLPTARDPTIQVFYRRDGKGPSFGKERLYPSTGLPVQIRETYGGDSLYYFHFDLLMPSIWGRLIVGFCAVTMLIAIVSGVVTHRRIFRDFFTFRPRRNQRSWLDAHNAFGVMALPYHILITYTGLVPLLFLYMPWGLNVTYPGDRPAFFEERGRSFETPPATGRAAALGDVAAMVATAREVWQGGRPGRITVHRPGDAAARVVLYRSGTETLNYRAERLIFDGVSGALLNVETRSGGASQTEALSYGLHLARFAGPSLRGLFFFSGLLGTAMVATGLLLWAVKRRSRAAAEKRTLGLGQHIVDRLNIAAIAGLPIGIAALFWANRLLPVGFLARADWEVRCFLLTWLATAIWSAIRPTGRAWIEELSAAAVLFALLPVLNAATSDRHLGRSLVSGDRVFAAFDLTMLAIGVAFAAAAIAVRRRQAPRTLRTAQTGAT